MSRTLGSALVCCSLLAGFAPHSLGQLPRPRPNEAEAQIEAALREPAKLEVVDQSLSDVVEQLAHRHKIAIQIDNRGVTDAGLASDTRITAHIEGVTLRSWLRLALEPYDLTYKVRDEVLMITSKSEAENMLGVKIYPVRDLVTAKSEFRSPPAPDEVLQEDYSELIELITATTGPTTWGVVGGPGSIQEYRHSDALAVSQTTEVHDEIGTLLAALREARRKQLLAAKMLDETAEKPPPAAEVMYLEVYHLDPDVAVNNLALQAAGLGGPFAVPDEAPTGDNGAADNGAGDKVARQPSGDSKPPAEADDSSPQKPGAEQFDRWAIQIADLLPKIIAPESWEPQGEGFVRAVAGCLVVRQAEPAQRKIAQLLGKLSPATARDMSLQYYMRRQDPGSHMVNETSIQLTLPGPQLDWPHEAEPRPNANEAAIEKALGSKLDLAFVNAPLSDVIKFIKQRTQLDVQVDLKALADAGLGLDIPIRRRLVGLTLRSSLRLLLDEFDLTYVVRDEVLLITTKTESENMLVCKVYPVFDLVVRPPRAPQRGRAVDYQSLRKNLTTNIAPTSWAEVGGSAAIQPFANAGVLVIAQTTEVHEEIVGYLRALREVSADQK